MATGEDGAHGVAVVYRVEEELENARVNVITPHHPDRGIIVRENPQNGMEHAITNLVTTPTPRHSLRRR